MTCKLVFVFMKHIKLNFYGAFYVNSFSYNYPLDIVTFYIGKGDSAFTSNYLNIQDVTVGYFPGYLPYSA